MVKPSYFPVFALVSTAAAANPVRTSSGTVEGHNATWPANSDVVEFLGIPFAQPPTGGLRFAAPQPFAGDSNQPFLADQFSEDCLQFIGGGGLPGDVSPALAAYGEAMGGGSAAAPHTYGEDCLTLNVWAKENGQTGKAVMVWIYGGGFTTGTSNAPFYSGSRLAQDEDVIVVSFNYRINIFGFPGAPDVPDQNVGLLDQRLAVEWVRDNIGGFGGDPSRITLFGESAGASSVGLYALAWTADPIVNGFIAQSTGSSARAPVNTSSWFSVSSALGCGGEEAGAATVECMRTKNATDIINTTGTQGVSGFEPAADERVVFSDAPQRSAAGNFVRKPLLVGSNDFELGLLRGLGAGTPFGGGGLSPNSSDATIQAATEVAFGCPAAEAAGDRIANGVPAWRYRYMGVWDNVALTPTTGCYHSSEIPIVLGTNPLRTNSAPDVPEQAALEVAMVHAWAEFAKDPEAGLERLGWPTYNAAGSTLIRLGTNNMSAIDLTSSTMYDRVCSATSTAADLEVGNSTATGNSSAVRPSATPNFTTGPVLSATSNWRIGAGDSLFLLLITPVLAVVVSRIFAPALL